jgi:hypothetical protein
VSSSKNYWGRKTDKCRPEKEIPLLPRQNRIQDGKLGQKIKTSTTPKTFELS